MLLPDNRGYELAMPIASTISFLLLSVLFARAQSEIKGTVRDAVSGEALAKVRVIAPQTESFTDAQGAFRIAGGGELKFSLVGYRTLLVQPAGENLDVRLTPDGMTQRDRLEVRESPFDAQVESSTSERTLSAAELRNLSGVIANDPLRAAQSLPGVASSNDFVATFSVRGGDFSRVGIFLDGVLLNNPLHSTAGQQSSGSLSMVGSDVIEELTLHAGAPPTRYMDRNNAVVDLRVREGSTQAPMFRWTAGVAASSFLAEGPLRRKGETRGSWLASVRKSYLQYLLQKANAIDSLAFGFLDAQAKLAYQITPRQQWTLGFFNGASNLDRSQARATLGVNSILEGSYHFTNLQLGHRYVPNDRVLLSSKFAWLRERSDNRNPQQLPLQGGGYAEWVANSDAEYRWGPGGALRGGSLRGGLSLRRIHDDGFIARYIFNPLSLRRRDPWGATAIRGGGYVEQTWHKGILQLHAGARVDDSSNTQPQTVSPHSGLRLRLATGTQFFASWSQAVQYSPLSSLTIANLGNANLAPSRAIHAVAGIEQSLSSWMRLRVELFNRADRDLTVQPLADPRLLPNGQVFIPPVAARFESSVRGYARGFEIFLQRRSANRWNGWVSYAHLRTGMRDGITLARYVADTEQRHTINGYASYRISASVNLSARYSYGSNFPVPGFYVQRGSDFFLSRERNRARLPAYHRTDFRIDKQFERKRWRGVLFVELMNAANASNRAFDSYNGFNATTQRANLSFLNLFPIVPAAGWTMDWGRR
jgi:hypothetical protein